MDDRATRQQGKKEIVRVWYEFAHLSDPETRHWRVLDDFGVEKQDYEFWWRTHGHLFAEIEPFYVHEIGSVEEFEDFMSDDPDNSAVVVVSLLETKGHLKAAFDEFLKARHKGQKGRRKYEDCAKRYSLRYLPRVSFIKNALEIYKLRKAFPDMPLEEIEKKFNLITKLGKNRHQYWESANSKATLKDQVRAQKDEVRRHLRFAVNAIDSAREGLFPPPRKRE